MTMEPTRDPLVKYTEDNLGELFKQIHRDKGILFVHLDTENFMFPERRVRKPLFEVLLVYIIVEKGSINLNIDFRLVHCSPGKNNLIEIPPHMSVYDMQMSPDFNGYLIALQKSFLDDNKSMIQLNLPNDVGQFTEKSCYTMSPDEFGLMIDGFRRLENNFLRKGHRYQHQIINLSALELYLETLNLIYGKRRLEPGNEKANRREEICRNFVTLLTQYVRKEHEVSFYAGQLCLTRQYLNKVVKESYNLPVKNMIANAIVSEAIVLLRQPNISVQRIAEMLNYPDLATFSKFFKRHVGLSPTAYRKMNR
jgi:AraC-like DNA-binding protein